MNEKTQNEFCDFADNLARKFAEISNSASRYSLRGEDASDFDFDEKTFQVCNSGSNNEHDNISFHMKENYVEIIYMRIIAENYESAIARSDLQTTIKKIIENTNMKFSLVQLPDFHKKVDQLYGIKIWGECGLENIFESEKFERIASFLGFIDEIIFCYEGKENEIGADWYPSVWET